MAKLIRVGQKWYSDFRLNGRRIRRPLSTDKREAERLLLELVHVSRSENRGEAPKEVSWQFFKRRYIEWSQAEKEGNTPYRDELSLRYLEETFPIQKLAQVTPELLERCKATWKKNGKTLSVVTRSIKAIKTAMRKAEEWGYIRPQNWRSVKVQEPKGRLLYYTMEEYEKLLSLCHGAWFTGGLLMGSNGLRIGEVYHLEWDDIDLQRQLIWIRAKDWEEGGKMRRWNPKGKKDRHVEMSEDVVPYLRSLPRTGKWVLGDDKFTLGSFYAYFKRLIRKAGLKGSPHTLRHTFASHMVSNGASLEAVAKLLGHSNLRTTQIYAHLMPHATRNAINLVPRLSSALVPVPAALQVV